ncbi:MAG: KH domain-containing protein [Dehalococcoidia bacterium]|nr:KH domain-containing protein [Dehalococcoidia bacterium]
MKELVEYLARSLVDHPDQVQVTEIKNANGVVYELRVAPDDMGRIIGKQGRVAQSMRALLKVAAARSGRRATLEIV